MKKVLIIGASGQVGTALSLVFAARGYKVDGTYQTNPSTSDQIKLNICDLTQILEKLNDTYDILCLTASSTNVDECEKFPEIHRKVNVESILHILNHVSFKKLVYFSTDYVFDGKSGPYSKLDLPNPIQEYGRQKFIAERIILDRRPFSLIIRTNMVYGPDPQKRNYSSRLRQCLEEGRSWNAFIDEYVTPTFNKDLAEKVLYLLDREERNVWHVAGSQVTSRYDFSKNFATKYGFDPNQIKPISVKDVVRAPRPIKGGLKCLGNTVTRSYDEVFNGESFEIF